MPPGYEDANDKSKPGDRKYGDLLLWFEIIDEARKTGKPVLFVTDDRKNDWWDNGVKPSHPHPELGNEMQERAGVLFHMFLPLDFSKWAGEKLNQRISQEAAEEIEEVGSRWEGRYRSDWFLDLLDTLSVAASDPNELPQDPRELRRLAQDLEAIREWKEASGGGKGEDAFMVNSQLVLDYMQAKINQLEHQ